MAAKLMACRKITRGFERLSAEGTVPEMEQAFVIEFSIAPGGLTDIPINDIV